MHYETFYLIFIHNISNVEINEEGETTTISSIMHDIVRKFSAGKKINVETPAPPFGEKRRSPKARFEPYRKEKNEIDENENRTTKSIKNTALQSVVEEVNNLP